MRAADLDDVLELVRLLSERRVEVLQRRDELADDRLGGRDVHRRRIGVVRRLAHIDVVVGMDGLLRTHHPAQHLDGAVRDDLVRIHVRLRARARLPDGEREMRVELAVDHFLRGSDDLLADILVEQAERHIGLGGGPLDDAERAHDGERLLLPADLEIGERTLRLGAPVFVGGDFDGTERVGLGAALGHGENLRAFCKRS